jgi:hypothetical protein
MIEIHADATSELHDVPGDVRNSELPPDDLICPLTGEIVDTADVDSLIDLYERLDKADKAIYPTKVRVRELLAAKTEGNARTRRVQGRRRAARVEVPGDNWDQSILKEAWNAYPAHRDKYLKIGTISPMAVECKKLVNTSGPPDFNSFRDMVTKANRGPTGTPTVKVEQ